jgi:alpha-2-macroglobulin
MMNRRTTQIAAVLFALAVPTIAQLSEAETYFSLSTERTFGPGEAPRVRLWGRGFERLQFRVYKVNDAVRFFQQLEDPNTFGGTAPRPPRALTPIERFHQWKQTSRTWMKNVVRQQFTSPSRQTIREALEKRDRPPVSTGTAVQQYAAIPVLNNQQVVSVWEQPHRPKQAWESQLVPVAVKERGVYVVEATDGKLQAYTIVCITDLVTITKAAAGAVTARVVERKNGNPVQGVQVLAWSNRSEIARGESGRDGFVEIRPKGEITQDALLLARRGQDFAPSVISPWSLRQGTDSESLTGYVYTDRPVYRPAHQVHYRAILRARRATGFSLPAAQEIEIEIDDPEGNSILRKKVKPNSVGTISGELTLAPTAALGYYGISLRNGENYAGNGGFHVEEYRKPEYAVKVTAQQPRVILGNAVRATVEARYYFGEPVPGAKVTYVVHRSRYWPPYYLDEGEEENIESQDEYSENEQILEETGMLDAEGKLTIQFPTEPAKHDVRYRIEARVTDQGNREVSGTGYVLGTQADFFIHAEPEKYVYAEGEQARIRVESRDYEGKFVPNIDFEVSLSADRGERVIATAKGRTGANGVGAAALRVTSGLLIARVVAKGSQGREVQDDTYLWVSGGGASSYRQQQRIEIIPDKKTYARGDVARVLLVTGTPSASIWVTAETTGILTSQIIESRGPTAYVDVPVRGEHAPNIFLNAVLVHDGQMYMGTKSLRVPPVEQKLDVSIQSSKPQYKPGERGVFTVEAKDSGGKPVSAEFSVGVVDEAIYAIRREAAMDLLGFFYGRRHNGVFTSSSLSYSFHGSSGKRRMQLARVGPPRNAQLKPERFVDPRIRKAFPDTIFWSADVRTGPNGRAEVPVTFPDSLTTWRTTARGITADTHVGSAVERTIVRKNLILRISAPRFFTQGDEVTISAIVQNYLSSEKTVRVSLDVQGLTMVQGTVRDVTVPSRGSAAVDYRVRASNPGSAVLLAKALTDEESDAMELTLPVNPYGVRLSDARSGSISTDTGEAEVAMTFPQDANPASRALEITVSPSIAGSLFSALDYLTSFPYGCTEQTMSSFLPNIIVSRAAKDLGLRSTVDEADLVKKIRAGLDRLYDYQHEEGGWGWWKTDDSSVFMTAYVVAGLSRAQAAGYSVKQEAIDKAVQWLKVQLPKEKALGADLRAYVVYALAESGRPDAALADAAWNSRAGLSPYGLAFLGLAARSSKNDRAEAVATDLERKARTTEQEVWWEVATDPLLGINWDSSVEATAHILHFLSLQRPSNPMLPKAALYLVNHKHEGNYWSSTKQTAMVIYGLTGYLKSTRELQGDFTAAVSVNGKPAATKRLGAADAMARGVPIRLSGDQVNGGANNVRVSKSGKGTLYWSVRTDYHSTSDRIARTGDGKLAISRDFFKLAPEKRENKVVYKLTPLGETVERGDLVAVKLRVTGTDWKYMLIEDPIPAGAEFVTRDDLYELDQKPDWWSRWMSRREFHDDRAAMFDSWFGSGETNYSYILKIVNPGKYRIPAARVAPMYQPNVFATSDARSLEVR